MVILTAVALEARAIASAWGLKTPKPGRPVHTADHVPMIEIHLIGIRGVRLPTNLTDPPVAAIILAGLAGALDPSLKIGDLIIDDCPANDWLPSMPHRVGKIACSPTILSTPADKQKLYAETGALAVEMESAPIRALAAQLNIPFLHIRAISDTAADAVDPAVLGLVDSFGRVRSMTIAGTLIRRPTLIPQLKQLGKDSGVAAANLAAAVIDLVGRMN